MNSSVEYKGPELVVFEAAKNWKSYFAAAIRPNVKGHVLEVGAGIGGVTRILCAHLSRGIVEKWLCLEPDASQCANIANKIENGDLPEYCHTMVGMLSDVAGKQKFDTILYVDVLEHIEFDLAELEMASQCLRPSGRLVVLAPAHQGLFSDLDRAASHFRRYTTDSLRALTPTDTDLIVSRYFDCIGMLASLANRLLLRQGVPTMRQILFWDRLMIPLSRIFDPILAYKLGKSVLVVWEKRDEV